MIKLIAFLVPAYLAAWLYERVQKKHFSRREFFVIYMIFVGIINMICFGVVGVVFQHPEYNVSSDLFNIAFTAKYLLLSLVVACVLPVVYRGCKNKVNLENIVLDKKQRLLISGLVNFFFTFTMIVFIPYDIFFANKADFKFGFVNFWWIMASFGLIVFLAFVAISMILSLKWFLRIQSIVFSVTLCAYIQRMFLNFYVTSVVNEGLNAGAHPIWGIVNLAIWACIILGIFILLVIKTNAWKQVLIIGSAGLIFVQGTAFASILLTEELTEVPHLTTEGLYEVSSENNIIMFVLDYYDYSFLDLLKQEAPDFCDRLDGFTYFDNTSAVYSRSYPANTYLLTGLELPEYYVEPYQDCVETAFSESTFLPDLKNLEFEINLYTNESYVGDIGGSLAANYSPDKYKLSYFKTVHDMLKCSFYFDMPYALKPLFLIYGIDTADVTSNVYQINDAGLYNELVETGLSIGESRHNFKYIHMLGAHPPYTLNEHCEEVPEGVTMMQQLKGCMNIVYEYLEQMKTLGVYEGSTIIITADHGAMVGDGELYQAVGPILFVKPAYAESDSLKISHAPVSHTDLFPTIINAAGGDYEAYGIPIFDIDENEKRTRIFHYSEMDNWSDREVINYKIPDNIKDFSNWEEISSEKVYESLYMVAK